jgi:hypothetical protein
MVDPPGRLPGAQQTQHTMQVTIQYSEGSLPSTDNVAGHNVETHIAARDQWSTEAQVLREFAAADDVPSQILAAGRQWTLISDDGTRATYSTEARPGRPTADETPASAHIHLRVTPERKSAYVRAAQAQGQNLSDWMTDTCDAAAGVPQAASITGGKRGFVAAVDAAFRAKLHNPTIRYSHSRGFHVESAHVPADADVIWSAAANYVLPSNRRSVRPADYLEVRAEILGA